MLYRIAVAVSLQTSVVLAAPAPAPTADRATLRQHCTGDYLTYCGDLSPDGPEVQACFRQNKTKLSPNCQAAITSFSKGQKRG